MGGIPSHRAHSVLSEFTDRSPYSVSMSTGAATGKSVREIHFPKFAANLRLPIPREVPFANSTIPQHSSPPPRPGRREPPPAGRATPPAGRLSGRFLDTHTSSTNFLATHRDWLIFTHFSAETNWKPMGLPRIPNAPERGSGPREQPGGAARRPRRAPRRCRRFERTGPESVGNRSDQGGSPAPTPRTDTGYHFREPRIRLATRAPIAQLVELRTFNPQVPGSSPGGGTRVRRSTCSGGLAAPVTRCTAAAPDPPSERLCG